MNTGPEPIDEVATHATAAVESATINEYDLARRKALLGIEDADCRTLAGCAPAIATVIDDIVEDFYRQQLRHPEIAAKISQPAVLRRLKRTMRSYILRLFGGEYDLAYAQDRLRIGRAHQRIGIAPKLYLAAVRLLYEVLEGHLDKTVGSESRTLARSLQKILFLDSELVLETYIGGLIGAIESHAGELERKNRALAEVSRKDMMTGLYNQRAFREHLQRESSNARRHKTPLSLVYLDLNGFKRVNDSKGHEAGDRILALVGRVLKSSVREGDIPCRYGGDEFCVILPDTRTDAATVLCHRLIDAFDRETTCGVTFSMGLAQTGPENFMTPDDLTKAADTLMYRAKARSRDTGRHELATA